ncbi:hypothetical protein ACFVG1_20300 [Streptomyces bacillaris]|uniref:hypothetical protein n=1 Tax=Streptomyces bacillaris TaxID=68179 RepID=UPI0035E191A3
MIHPRLSVRVRRAALACLSGGLLLVGASSTPVAADTRPSIRVDNDTLTVQTLLDGRFSGPKETFVSVDGAENARGKLTVTFDASDLEGFFPESTTGLVPCDADGDLIGECDHPHQRLVLDATAKATAAGRSGRIRITAKVDGKVQDTAEVTVRVTDPGPVFDRAPTGFTDVEPGSRLELPGGFSNYSRYHGYRSVIVGVYFPDGLSPVGEFGNCAYEEDGADPSPANRRVVSMSCRLTGPFPPGGSYDLDLGPVEVGHQALSQSIHYSARPERADGEGPERLQGRPGKGRPLTFTERGDDATHVRIGSLPATTTVRTTNQADFSVNHVTLNGKVGDVVAADFFFVNNGPGTVGAVFDSESDNETAQVIELAMPQGITVVKTPEGCRKEPAPQVNKKAKAKKKANGPLYRCWQRRMDKSVLMPPGHFEHFPFSVRLDKPGRSDNNTADSGYVLIKTELTVDEFDEDKDNNRSHISLDVKAAPRASATSTEQDTASRRATIGGAAAGVALACAAHIPWRRRGIRSPSIGTDATGGNAAASEGPEPTR